MAPTLSRGAISYLAPPTNEEDQYTYPDQPHDGSEDTSGNDRDSNNAYGKVEDDEGYESSPDVLKNDHQYTDKRSASTPETLDATNGTLFRRLEWAQAGSRTDYRNSMDTRYGPDSNSRPQPWPKVKTIFAFGEKDRNGNPKKETVTFAKCISDFPNTLSTCEINGIPGPEYAKSFVDDMSKLATSNNRRDRELAFEKVMDGTRKIAESRCNMQKSCRRTLNREINYLRRPEDEADPMYVTPIFLCLILVALTHGSDLMSTGTRLPLMGLLTIYESQRRNEMGPRRQGDNSANRFNPWSHSIVQSVTIPLQSSLNSLALN
jgi:hypothetical protein